MDNIFRKFGRDIFSIWLVGLAIFLFLALISFNPADPSLNSIGRGLHATNFCGIVGSFIADLAFHSLGLSIWLLVFGLVNLSYQAFREQSIDGKKIRILWLSLFAINISGFLAIIRPEEKIYSNQIYLGGVVGIGLAKMLTLSLNEVGAKVFLTFWSTILVLLYFDKTVKELCQGPLISNLNTRSLISPLVTLKNLIIKAKTLSGIKYFSSFNQSEVRDSLQIERIGNSSPKMNRNEGEFKFQIAQPKALFGMDNPQVVEQELYSHHHFKLDETQGLALVGTQLENQEDHQESELLKKMDSTPKKNFRKDLKIKIAQAHKVENWKMPHLAILEDPPSIRIKVDREELKKKADLLLDKLNQFSVQGQIVSIKPGPAVTMFEFKPNANVKVSKITELAEDLTLALSSESLRIIAPLPGRDVVGIESSNSVRDTVFFKELIEETSFWKEENKLPIALGKQANGEPKIVDLRRMPHLLIAGTTGSGKSVFTVSLIIGLLMKHSPKTLRLIMVDPKQVDLAVFSELPHLLMPPVREPKKAVAALKWAIREMEKRYRSMAKFSARGLEGFNETVEKLSEHEISEHREINNNMELSAATKGEQYYFTHLPYIVIVVEEFGDLMSVDKQNVENAVVRLAQMARACGIHLILAMQSPRKEVVTGLIKANIPGRISFKVASKMDSRVILDEGGAERLLAQGDMLFLAPGVGKPQRHHGPFLKESEISEVVRFWSAQGAPNFDPMALRIVDSNSSGTSDSSEQGCEGESLDSEEYDDRYDEILAWTGEQKEVSASLIQRRFRLGYPRAARIIELFEREGVIGPASGSKPRQVLINNLRNLD